MNSIKLFNTFYFLCPKLEHHLDFTFFVSFHFISFPSYFLQSQYFFNIRCVQCVLCIVLRHHQPNQEKPVQIISVTKNLLKLENQKEEWNGFGCWLSEKNNINYDNLFSGMDSHWFLSRKTSRSQVKRYKMERNQSMTPHSNAIEGIQRTWKIDNKSFSLSLHFSFTIIKPHLCG